MESLIENGESRQPHIVDSREGNDVIGGSGIGKGEPFVVDEKFAQSIRLVEGTWNDYTQRWETIQPSRRQKTYELVQRRLRLAEFSRQFSAYRAAVSEFDASRGLPGGVHGPEADRIGGIRTVDSGNDLERGGGDLRSDSAELDDSPELE